MLFHSIITQSKSFFNFDISLIIRVSVSNILLCEPELKMYMGFYI